MRKNANLSPFEFHASNRAQRVEELAGTVCYFAALGTVGGGLAAVFTGITLVFVAVLALAIISGLVMLAASRIVARQDRTTTARNMARDAAQHTSRCMG